MSRKGLINRIKEKSLDLLLPEIDCKIEDGRVVAPDVPMDSPQNAGM